VLRSLLANALAEVGVFENGSDQEKRRIVAYWSAVRPEFPANVNNLTVPWSGAWAVRQSGAALPKGAAAHVNWRNWDAEVSPDALAPGMIALFRLDSAGGPPSPRSRLLLGVVVRRQPGCI
jgi:hypothetical protein